MFAWIDSQPVWDAIMVGSVEATCAAGAQGDRWKIILVIASTTVTLRKQGNYHEQIA